MADEEKVVEGIKTVTDSDTDSVQISPDVIAVIAGLAAAEIKGIAGMSGGIVGGITEMLGRKDLSKGIKVQMEQEKVKVDLNVVVDMGVQIVEVSNQLRQEVRDSVEKFTGLKVAAINVHVVGINIPKEQQEDKPPKETK